MARLKQNESVPRVSGLRREFGISSATVYMPSTKVRCKDVLLITRKQKPEGKNRPVREMYAGGNGLTS